MKLPKAIVPRFLLPFSHSSPCTGRCSTLFCTFPPVPPTIWDTLARLPTETHLQHLLQIAARHSATPPSHSSDRDEVHWYRSQPYPAHSVHHPHHPPCNNCLRFGQDSLVPEEKEAIPETENSISNVSNGGWEWKNINHALHPINQKPKDMLIHTDEMARSLSISKFTQVSRFQSPAHHTHSHSPNSSDVPSMKPSALCTSSSPTYATWNPNFSHILASQAPHEFHQIDASIMTPIPRPLHPVHLPVIWLK